MTVNGNQFGNRYILFSGKLHVEIVNNNGSRSIQFQDSGNQRLDLILEGHQYHELLQLLQPRAIDQKAKQNQNGKPKKRQPHHQHQKARKAV